MIYPFFVVGLVFFAISLTAIAFEEPERRSFFMVTASLSILVMVLSVCVMIERETPNQTPQYNEMWECVEFEEKVIATNSHCWKIEGQPNLYECQDFNKTKEICTKQIKVRELVTE